MELKRLLYATNRANGARQKLLEILIGLAKTGPEEITLASTKETSVAELQFQELRWHLSNQGARVEVSGEKENLQNLILKMIKHKPFSFVIADFDRDKTKPSFSSAIKTLTNEVSVPTLILDENGQASNGAGIFEHLLFATNWSPSSERAADFIGAFNPLIKEMDIVNVIQDKLTVGELRQLKKRLQETRKRFSSGGIDAEFHIYAGKTAEEIMWAAGDYKASVIVMGASRKPFLKRIFSRSTSHQVTAELRQPVLLVP